MAGDRSNEWIGSAIVGVGLGAAGVAGALAWVSYTLSYASIPIWFFVSAAVVAIVRGPLGAALATRIAAPTIETTTPPFGTELFSELDEMRHHVAELEERVDFAERMLAAPRQPERLDAGPLQHAIMVADQQPGNDPDATPHWVLKADREDAGHHDVTLDGR